MKSTENRVKQPLTLPRSRILRGKRNFQRLFKEGSVISEQHVSLRYVIFANDFEDSLIGFITGRRIGKAHERNFVRRHIREAYRLNQDILSGHFQVGKPAFHAAFIAKTAKADYSTLQHECVQLLKRLSKKLEHHSV
ncbi:MAG: ribonuclease P protein component [Balneolales bacterium]